MHTRTPLLAATLTLAVSTALAATPATPPAAPLPDDGGPNAIWRNPAKTPDERAKDLLPRLTLEEKIALLHGDGTFTHAGVPRLNIPKTWMDDGPQGVREEVQSQGFGAANRTDDFSTALPADIALAATFDVDLAKAYGNVIGEEAKTRGKNIMLCPAMNIMRTPLNGRSSEYFGEDPWLASRIAVGFVNGIQQNGVAATAKHYALNNQESSRNSVNAKADERTIREIYLPAFKAAVTEAHVWAIMSSYNRINGHYASENDFLLNQVLKKDWNFQGLVMSDWGGTHSTVNAALAGSDLEMGTNSGGAGHTNDFFATPLLNAVQSGQVPQSRVDDMALRNLRVMAATGVLDVDMKRLETPPNTLLSPAHIEAARKIAESGIVLLKNQNNVLPLDSTKTKSIAIIGDNAKAKFAHDGNSAQIKTSYEITPFDGITKRAGDAVKITYAQGYARPAGGGRGRRGAPGAAPAAPAAAPNAQALIDEAVAAAKAADVAVVCAGLYRNQDQEGADRLNMNLPAGQAELIAAVVAANPKTLVILNGGSPSVVSPWIDNTAGLLMYWYGGTEGGNALARILFGDVSPSGHLPCSWPKQLADSPAHNSGNAMDYPGVTAQPATPPAAAAAAPGAAPAPGAPGAPAARGRGGRGPLAPDAGPQETYSEGLLVGYRWFDAKNIAPQFPFGHGLSYTSFQLSDLLIAMSRTAPGTNMPYTATVSCTLTNTGTRDGAEVVQVYISQSNPTVLRAPKELKAFTKVMLKPGEKKQVSLEVPPAAFTHYDPAQHAWVAEPGEYTLSVGDSSQNLPLKSTFNLTTPILIKEGP